MEPNADEATAGSLHTSDRRVPACCGKILGQFPTPYQHLRTMFGLGITASALMLLGLPIYFYGSTDVDTQSHRRARYCVDINCPRWAEFANLPLIGEKTAQSIVKHGQAIGGFGSVGQLLDVKGVGAKTLAKIQSFLVHANKKTMGEQREVPNNLLSGD